MELMPLPQGSFDDSLDTIQANTAAWVTAVEQYLSDPARTPEDLSEAEAALADLEQKARRHKRAVAIVAAAHLRVQQKLAEMLPPPVEPAERRRGRKAPLPAGVTDRQASRLRKLANRPDVVDAVINEGTDDSPPSLSKVERALAEERSQEAQPGTIVCPRCKGSGRVKPYTAPAARPDVNPFRGRVIGSGKGPAA